MASNGILIALMEMVIIYKLEGRKKHMTYITAGVTMVGISFLLLNIPGFPIFTAIAMNILFSLGEMLSMPFMNSYWIARTNTSNRGQYAALYTMAWSAAQTIGPVAGSQIAEHAGFRILWWAVGGVSLCAAFAFYKWHGRAV